MQARMQSGGYTVGEAVYALARLGLREFVRDMAGHCLHSHTEFTQLEAH